MPIRVLNPWVAAQIAAGEVVERPASVVKELVENALDAGASAVRVEVNGGGLGSIRVVDNGSGIPTDETELLFQHHATSKLQSSQDLAGLRTLGFRGEALHSIAAVARLSLLTRTAEASTGVYLEAWEGRLQRREPRGAPQGTTVLVRGLFQSVPARLKFLKSPAAEAARVQTLLGLYVLAYPEVRFTLLVDGRQAMASPGGGELRQAAAEVYGTQVARELLEFGGPSGDAESPDPAKGEGEQARVWGLVSPPHLHRANRSYIAIFVNRRPVQARSLAYSLEEAYHGFLPEGRHPLAAVNIALPPEEVDVNVHPAKAEVRFRNEGQVYRALQRAVRGALVAIAPVPSFDMEPPATVVAPAGPPPLVPSRHLPIPPIRSPAAQEGGTPSASQGLDAVPPASPGPAEVLPVLRVVGQVQSTYIVAEGPDGLYLVDQHAAHERVLFERVLRAVGQHAPETQGLLAPVVVELSPVQAQTAREVGLARFGWQAEPFGEHALLVRAVPSVLAGRDAAQSLVDLLDTFRSETATGEGEARMAATIACHSAVRAGQSLSSQEMSEMLRLLEGCQEPHTCPHGRPTIVHLSVSHLEREFRRR
ncbi:MAG: DNA mismatch repair endonuclease MutL [Chloroflexi bacterium]|nr:DNA mismatch repair endonuclease MutL [Chloroflexota bacterium]